MGKLLWSLRSGIFGASALVLVGTGIAVSVLDLDFNLFWVVVVGLAVGQTIGTATEWFTSYEYRWTKNLAEQTRTGPATTMKRAGRRKSTMGTSILIGAFKAACSAC